MSARYEITDADHGAIRISHPSAHLPHEFVCIHPGADPWSSFSHGVIRQQSADLDKLRAELAAALDLLDTIFAAYEDGAPCYQDPDEISGYLGNAVLLDDDTFRRAASLLNQSKPRKDGE